MMIVRLTTPSASWPLALQTPGASGIWDGVQFVIDRDCAHADAWVVYEKLPAATTTVCPPSRTILITGEPPMIKSYPEAFAAQFAKVLTCHAMRHAGVVAEQQALPWHYGRESDQSGDERFVESYDSLAGSSPFETKSRLLSIICSTKRKRYGHRKRHEFVSFLERTALPELDIFGRGRAKEAACKRDAIAPYKYHIVLENSECADYWTEKLADAYLGGAFPFYWGCPNIEKYFPQGAFARIDIERPEEAVRTIMATIEQETYERSLPLLREARDRVLDSYNLFPAIVSLLRTLPDEPAVPVTLRPEESFTLRGQVRRARLGVKALFRRARGLGPYA